MSQPEIKFRYFSPKQGHAVARFGTDSHIGAERTPSGFTINPDAIAAIPETEFHQFRKEYLDALRNKELVERSKEDFDAWTEKLAAEDEAELQERKNAEAEAAAVDDAEPVPDAAKNKPEPTPEQDVSLPAGDLEASIATPIDDDDNA